MQVIYAILHSTQETSIGGNMRRPCLEGLRGQLQLLVKAVRGIALHVSATQQPSGLWAHPNDESPRE